MMNKKLDLEKIKELYFNKKLSTIKIGKLFNVSDHTIWNRLKEANVSRRYKGEGKKVYLDMKKIEDLYINQRKSSREIGKIFGVSHRMIIHRLKDGGIIRRHPKIRKELDSEKLKKEYIDNKKTTREISKILMVSPSLISHRLKEIGVKLREKNCPRINLDNKEIIRLYNNGLTMQKIQEMFNCHHDTIHRILKENNIRIKSRKEILNENKTMENLWQNKEYREKQLKKMYLNMGLKPNKPEKVMINLIKENNFPFLYTGDYKARVMIGGFIPDFMCNPSKKIIEVFGDYWHNKIQLKERDKRRIETYKKYGFDTLIIWEHELKNPSQVVNKIKNFIK